MSVPLLRESTFSRGRGQTRHHDDRDRHRRDDLRLLRIVQTSRSLRILFILNIYYIALT